jgi:hypothetical protein
MNQLRAFTSILAVMLCLFIRRQIHFSASISAISLVPPKQATISPHSAAAANVLLTPTNGNLTNELVQVFSGVKHSHSRDPPKIEVRPTPEQRRNCAKQHINYIFFALGMTITTTLLYFYNFNYSYS